VDARATWRQALDGGIDRAARIALQALGERAEPVDAQRVRPFLQAPVPRTRLAALKAIAAAQPDDIDQVLARALFDPSRRVVGTALELFWRRPGRLDADKLRAAFAANAGGRRLLLAAARGIGQWQGLLLLLEWFPDAVDVREALAAELRYWVLDLRLRAMPLPAGLREPLQLALAGARTDSVDVDWARIAEVLA
jgi:hypothetical protein